MKKYFNKALFIENLKRYWSVAAIYFVFIYLPGIDHIRMNVNEVSFYTMHSILTNRYVWPVFYAIFSVIAAFVVFSYLNTTKSSTLIHAMPVTRKALFITNYISGTVLFTIPLVLTTILLFVFKSPTVSGFTYAAYPEVYTTSNILSWALQSFCINAFTFSVATFGIIISGSGVITALTAIALNFLAPSVLACLMGFAQNSYFGYSETDIFEKIINTSPFGIIITSGTDYYDPCSSMNGVYLIFLLVGYAISLFAYYLYTFRKIENSEDSYVFKIVEKIIGFLFVFIPCSACGLVFYEIWGSMAYFYGGFVGFVIGQMISRKTFKIFNKEGFKNLIVFALIMVIVVGSFSFDLFGYEKRVPSIDDIERVDVSSSFFIDVFGTGDTFYSATEQNTIQNVINLHKELIFDKKYLTNDDNFKSDVYPYEPYASGHIKIGYVLKDGSTISREYYVPTGWISNHDSFKAVYLDNRNNSQYGKNLSILKNYDAYSMEFSLEKKEETSDTYIRTLNISKEQKNVLINLLQTTYEDYKSMMYIDNGYPVGYIYISFKVPAAIFEKNRDTFEKIAGYSYQDYLYNENNGTMDESNVLVYYNYSIYESYEEIIDWMLDVYKTETSSKSMEEIIAGL